MKISFRGWLVIGTFSALVIALAAFATPWLKAAGASPAKTGQLSEQSLGNLLAAMGLEPKKIEQRYDFKFKAIYQKEEWDLSMTAVLSQDGSSVWVMAWLDELPRSAADVPRTALLRLLAQNDHMGKGKFFAYIASNRRFVLQRVVKNERISTAEFRDVLRDLGSAVVASFPQWSVANWRNSTSSTKSVSSQRPTGNGSAEGRTPLRNAQFKPPIRR